uniref:Uncharacterized protein n=1 Tax=Panagrolaimus sp. ES5 TaxID=591445 RepID=A0AC34F4U0_9BILA
MTFGCKYLIKWVIIIFIVIAFCKNSLQQDAFDDSVTTIDTLELEGEETKLFCPEITAQGVKFPKTPACQEAVVSCPNSEETVGHIRFTCGCEHGTWMNSADFSNCTHKWVGEVSNRISNGDNSVNIVEQLFVNLRTNVAEQKLFGGDISGIIDASQLLVPLAHSQLNSMSDVLGKVTFAQNFTNLLGNSGDQLLSDSATKAWEQLKPSEKIKRASNLMLVLEQSMVLISENKAEFQQSFSNWASRTETKIQPANDMMFSPISRIMAAASAPAPEASKVVEFSGFQDGPIMELPGLDSLSSFTIASAPMSAAADQPSAKSRTFNFPTTTDSTKFGYFVYKSVGNLLVPNSTTVINSRVMGAFINDPQQSIELAPNQAVNFTFPHIRKSGVENPRCVYWDLNEMEWSQRGCILVETAEEFTKCSCTHLTSFAILMDINSNLDRLIGGNAIALDLITIFGCALSVVCLCITFLIFTLFRSLYTVRHAIHRNLCLCLLVANLLFVIGIDRAGNLSACRGVAIALHYFFLASFCWMLLEGYQLYMMLIQVFEPNRSRFYLYYLIGYALPAVIVAISAGVSWQNYGTSSYCWINVRTSTLWAFIIPIIVIIVANIIVLLIALRVVLSVKSRDRSTSQRVLGWLKGSGTLLCLLGITWIFGFLCAIPGTHIIFAYIFAILNTLQGVFIFILHVVFNDKVRTVLARAMRQNLCCGVEAQTSSVGGYSTRTGQTFFSKQKILHFFKSPDHGTESRSSRNSESTEEKQNSPKMYAKITKSNQRQNSDEMINEFPPPPSSEESDSAKDLQIQHWHSKSLEEEMTDRPSIIVTPTTLMISTTNNSNIRERNVSLPSPTKEMPHNELLKVDSLQNRHSAPVKRKKFPLGSTDEQRSGELRGTIELETKCPNIIVEKL